MTEDINRKKALFNKLSQELSRKSREDNFPQDKLQKLLKLKDQAAKAIGREAREAQAKPHIIKNYTDKIKTRVVKKLPDAAEHTANTAKKRALLKAAKKGASKFVKTGMKSLPLVGGLAAALASGDASAAVPILGDVESLGPKKGSEEAKLEDMSLPMEERIKLLKAIKNKKEE